MSNNHSHRAGAYYWLAPLIGAFLAIALLGEPLTARLVLAGVLMGVGLLLHLAASRAGAAWPSAASAARATSRPTSG
ncbi:hypothetical protein MESS2_980072 [Mesorhizobium metallidurans STM 2683]|uniref:EamA domain-containing protein n=2 Tax=Mesorhizobium metallidurans TaxID=489722 RepID=M5EWH1_9HYPH|nr:hypothetical protein MESS2_980072 [Mesorhizobium metallidurans STM 2683]